MNTTENSRRDFLKAIGFYASSFAISGCASGSKRPADEASEEKTNILWITCEDISPYLGCYGDAYAITANLDKLAGQAVLYTNAFATASV